MKKLLLICLLVLGLSGCTLKQYDETYTCSGGLKKDGTSILTKNVKTPKGWESTINPDAIKSIINSIENLRHNPTKADSGSDDEPQKKSTDIDDPNLLYPPNIKC